jgi:hypothetical protein
MTNEFSQKFRRAGELIKAIEKDGKRLSAFDIARKYELYHWRVPDCLQTILFCDKNVDIIGTLHIHAITYNVELDPTLMIYDDDEERWSWELDWEKKTITHVETD